MTLQHFFLVRHGETPWNAEGRIQGQTEIDIGERGRAQALRNGQYLKTALGGRIDEFRFLASPMRRTRETMEIVRQALGLDLDPLRYETDARLIELSFGDWQGSTLAEIGARDPQSIRDREAGKWDYVPPGASSESYAMLAARAAPVFEGLTGPTVIVAHGGIARIVLKLYGGLPGAEAAHVPIPQDRILEHRDGRLDWV